MAKYKLRPDFSIFDRDGKVVATDSAEVDLSAADALANANKLEISAEDLEALKLEAAGLPAPVVETKAERKTRDAAKAAS